MDTLTGFEDDLGITGVSDFTLVDNGTSRAIYTTVYDGYTSELAVYSFDSSTGRWSDRIMLTDYGKYIRDYSVAEDLNGNTTVALNLIDVNEDANEIYGNSTMIVTDISTHTDLELTDSISYEEGLVEPNGQVPISFEVKNNSNHNVEQFTAKLLDENGEEITSEVVKCSMEDGETATAQILYNLPETISFHKVILQVQAE